MNQRRKFRIPYLGKRQPAVAVVRLAGVIGRGAPPVRSGLSASGLVQTLERAFSLKGLRAVALAVNSPGGAPAQSALIQKRIRALAEEKGVPVIAFTEDVAASGGYWLACAADEIYADESSIIGSIGVISSGFGFTELLDKIGVERRLHTSGDRKGMLDPFSPENPDHVERLEKLQGEIHESFKQMVRERRAGKLKGDERDLFSGEFWTGKRALELGLVDGIGELTQVMREKFGENVKFRPVGQRQSWLKRRFGLGPAWSGGLPDFHGGWADDLLGAVEARGLWGRYGL